MSCCYLKHCISPNEKNLGVMFQIADPWALTVQKQEGLLRNIESSTLQLCSNTYRPFKPYPITRNKIVRTPYCTDII